jgi:hypothetical protein
MKAAGAITVQGTPAARTHDVPETGGCRVDEGLAVPGLGGRVGAERSGDREQGVRSVERGVEGGAVVEVRVPHLRSEVAQSVGGGRAGWRVSARTRWPALSRARAAAPPWAPVAPVTATLSMNLQGADDCVAH